MRKYPENETAPIEFVKLKKIVVESEDDKKELLEAFKYLHDFSVEDKNGNLVCLDNNNIAINLLMHLYLNPETIEVEKTRRQAILLELEEVVLDVLSGMTGFDLTPEDKGKYLNGDLNIDDLDFVEVVMKIEHIFHAAVDDCVMTSENVTIAEFIKNIEKNLIIDGRRD